MVKKSTGTTRSAVLIDALLGIVAEQGFDQVSVRQVATAAGVSIGTVQHYFPTKDQMLAAAFTEVAQGIRRRIEAVPLGDDVRDNLSRVLRELLPIDGQRKVEARIQVAFSAAAANSPDLAVIQRTVLTEIHRELTEAFKLGWGEGASATQCRRAAHVALALVDGLALHAVSSGGWLGARAQSEALSLMLGSLLPGEAGRS
ncbi:TetR/AcrR family transcriptional regulator [Nocardioides jensenii]|uniref:TetR/AcrR family transcriptional regulator n=1 Tax=Nocardioides jensenii TaxID=1843 RepID=UPI000A4E6EA5|nr:TetR/AcrR family transcriptional regulator [Nocardioides jensenii]